MNPKNILILILVFNFQLMFAISSWNYPTPAGITAHPDYLVEARIAGSEDEFEPIFTYSLQVCKSNAGWPGNSTTTNWIYENTAVSMFDAPGSMEIRVTKLTAGAISTVTVRPLSKGINAIVSGQTVSFFISGPVKLSVEINGEIYRNLNIIANPFETNVPLQGDVNTIWFGPGVSNIQGTNGTGVLNLNAGQTLYLAPGAVVKGAIRASGANITIRGRGILSAEDFADDSGQWALEAWRCNNLVIDGILVTGSPDNSTVLSDCNVMNISNFKVIDGRHWDDGIHMNACKNVLVDDAYIRTSDDCVPIYGANLVNYSSSDWSGVDQTTTNITIQNSTLWSDVAHPMLIGTHGMVPNGNSLSNITFKNIDVLEHKTSTWQNGIYQGVMSITANENNTVTNTLFEDIRIERMTQGQIFHIQTNKNTDYSTNGGKLVDGVTFRRVSWMGTSKLEALSTLKCTSAAFPIKNVVFEDCQRNGTWIKDIVSGNLSIDANVQNVNYLYPQNEKPGILVQPAHTIIPSDKTAILRVVAAGAATLSYQWYEGDSAIISNPINNSNSATFETPSLSKNMTKYWVKVSNGKGSVNSTAATVKTMITDSFTSLFNPIVSLDSDRIVDIFPNPCKAFFTTSAKENILSIQIVDLLGIQKKSYLNILADTKIIETGDLNPGIYFVVVKLETNTSVKKIISN
jgi:hypothetical protein